MLAKLTGERKSDGRVKLPTLKHKGIIMATSEHMLQTTCISYIREVHPNILMWSSLNGIKLDGKNKYGTIAKEKQSGFVKGVPDTTICIPNGITLHVEFKKPGGKQSAEQKAIQTKLEELEHKYYLCFSFQEFKQIIKDYI